MPPQARYAVFHGPLSPLELRSGPLPALGEQEALVRLSCTTLCGSDLHTFSGKRIVEAPLVLGHEMLGRVVDVHPLDPPTNYLGQPLKVGDRVTWTVGASCGNCRYCLRGLSNKCETLFKYGHQRILPGRELGGGMADHCLLVPGTTIVPVPDELPDVVAAPANCATATVAACLRQAGDLNGRVVLVQGLGMLGLTACAMARVKGAKAVIAVDLHVARLTQSLQFGATHTAWVEGTSGVQQLAKLVAQVTNGTGVDVALELSGSPAAFAPGLAALGTGGVYVLAGAVFPQDDVKLNMETVVRRVLTIRGVHNYTAPDLVAAVDFLTTARDLCPWASLVEREFSLEDAQAAFEYATREQPLRVAIRAAT